MITDLPRETIEKLVKKGELNKAALLHWDICNARKTKTIVMVADEFNVSEELVKWVKRCKC